GVPPTSSFQQPMVALSKSRVVSSFRQWPCGTSVPGAAPEPGCCCLGGTPYVLTPRTLIPSPTAGVAASRDEVLVSDHRTILFELWVPEVPVTGFCPRPRHSSSGSTRSRRCSWQTSPCRATAP